MSIIPYTSINNKITTNDFNFRIDYFLHAFAYFTLTIFYFLWKRKKLKIIKYNLIITYGFFSFLLAISTEIIQMIIPGRTFNPVDIYANAGGIVFGLVLIPILRTKKIN